MFKHLESFPLDVYFMKFKTHKYMLSEKYIALIKKGNQLKTKIFKDWKVQIGIDTNEIVAPNFQVS